MVTTRQPREQELASFRSLLTRVLPDPQAVIYTSARPAGPVDRSLWEKSLDLDGFRSIAQAIRGRIRQGEGTLVVVADVREDASARAYIAARAARLLAEEGLRVLLVETTMNDGGFLGVEQADDHEGFVDLVLYGVSPQVACRPTPSQGIDLMTPGSFPPDPGELYDDPDLGDRLAQLKVSYDVVLMLGVAFSEGQRPHPLLAHVDGLIIACRPPASPRFQAWVEALPQHAAPVWGAVVFTSPTDTVELAVEDALDEREWPVTAPQRPRSVAPGKVSSSSLFRWGTIVLALALLGFAGWWGWMQRGGEPGERPPAARTQASLRPGDAESSPAVGGDDTSPAAEEPAQTTPASSETAADAAGREVQPEPSATSPAENAQAAGSTPHGATSGPDAAPSPSAPARAHREDVPFDEVAVEEEDVSAAQDAIPQGLTRAPGGGYSIHLWSFPDSLEAEGARGALRRDGLASAVVAASIPGKGTWYRVVVGRFASAEQAKEGRELLMRRPDVDWAAVVRVP